MSDSTRRRFLQASGVAGFVGTAGCLRLESSDTSNSMEPQETATTQTGERTVSQARSEWTVLSGSWQFGDTIRQTEDGTHKIAFADTVDFTDGAVTAEMNSVDGTAGQFLLFRLGVEDNEYRYYMFGTVNLGASSFGEKDIIFATGTVGADADTENTYIDVVDGKPASELDLPLSADTFYSYRIDCRNTSLVAAIDGERVLSVEDERIEEGGRVGFQCGGRTAMRNLRYESFDQ